MAKKAKRRGRPPGSKNKPRGVRGRSVAKLEVSELRAHIEGLQKVLERKISEQRAYYEGQLAELGVYALKKASTAVRAVTAKVRARAKVKPKYQSKKDRSLKWSGRGALPRWMVAEMKGTKLKKEDFLIE